MVTSNNIVLSFMTIRAVPYIRIKELVLNECVADCLGLTTGLAVFMVTVLFSWGKE